MFIRGILRINMKILIVFLVIILAIFYFYFLHQHNSYEHKALNYMKEVDTKQTYKYLGKSDEDCKMMQGCRVEVYLEGKITGESVTILFINGRLAPFAKTQETK
ncbi:hypothetical protein HZF08_06195 [Paenibacillus sp. CGMCC 1.16610]|uniref:Uncharacterized protein n=1 Tax=Paenibacillus anseongense TaxID=2682845 RepID=A0ABW9UAH1_9BACL|nr:MULTISPECIES: hypothetical protein [Paenibacillus]MBA2937890.1 hypothetical protein [Paenibacillus sp. CGMCC 1.16610]MVQ36948.1 hypothetical protein [Paenibacillus anseongense]